MLEPHVSTNVKEKLKHKQTTQKKYYDRTAKNLPPLNPNDTVRYQGKQTWEPAVILDRHSAPRSYNIKTAEGRVLRRNRRHLRKTSERPPNVTTTIDDPFTIEDSASAANQTLPIVNVQPPQSKPAPVHEKRTRSGRVVRPPTRYPDD